jgi:Co/Zn/Cd efflux system component
LHVWAVSSGSNVMTSHVVVRDSADGDAVLAAVVDAVSDAFEIHHCTIQIEQLSTKAFHRPHTDRSVKPSTHHPPG